MIKYEKEVLDILLSPIVDFNPNILSNYLDISLPKLIKGLDYSVYAWAENPLRLKSFWKKKLVKDFNEISSNNNFLVGYRLEKLITSKDRINKAVLNPTEVKL